jgi:hypothetical protein
MDAETEALRASGIERQALKPGAVAPDFMLPDACVKAQLSLSFTEVAGAPIAICTCGAFNELCPRCRNLGRKS